MYGHVQRLAEEIKKGAESVEGVDAKLWQVTSEKLAFENFFTDHDCICVPLA